MRDDYFRGDQRSGITAPDLSKTETTYAEHIVSARGKKDRYTSVSLDARKAENFCEVVYRLRQDQLLDDGHELVEHSVLMEALQLQVKNGEAKARDLASRALVYARRHKEGLIDWRFDISRERPKDIIGFGFRKVQTYFEVIDG